MPFHLLHFYIAIATMDTCRFHTDITESAVEEATKQAIVVLDLIAWMCHGQRAENQELFREQENNFNVRTYFCRYAAEGISFTCAVCNCILAVQFAKKNIYNVVLA